METFSTQEFYTVVIGGTILSTIAGCINASVFTGNIHVTVSHITGNLTRLGSNLALGIWLMASKTAGFTVCFFLGSLASGLMIDSTKFQLGRAYGIALLVESMILIISWIWYELGHLNIAGFSASFACGLQNAFCTGFSGAVLRTTHMTGITTDIGIICGQLIRRNPRAESWKLKVFVPLWVGYLVGAIIGTSATLVIQEHAILIPALVLCILGVFYLTWAPARNARALLAIALKKVQVELELGMSKTVDIMVDGVDGISNRIPSAIKDPIAQLAQHMIPNVPGSPISNKKLSVVATGEHPGFHPLVIPNTPQPAIQSMIRQVHVNQFMDTEISKAMVELSMNRQNDKKNSSEPSERLPHLPESESFDDLGDDENERFSILRNKSPAVLQ